MYASVRRYQTDPSSVEEIKRRVEEGFVPLISEGAGFLAYYLVDAGGGVLSSISVFEDREGAEESNRRAAEWVEQNLSSLLPNPPEVVAGEVGVHKEAAR